MLFQVDGDAVRGQDSGVLRARGELAYQRQVGMRSFLLAILPLMPVATIALATGEGAPAAVGEYGYVLTGAISPASACRGAGVTIQSSGHTQNTTAYYFLGGPGWRPGLVGGDPSYLGTALSDAGGAAALTATIPSTNPHPHDNWQNLIVPGPLTPGTYTLGVRDLDLPGDPGVMGERAIGVFEVLDCDAGAELPETGAGNSLIPAAILLAAAGAISLFTATKRTRGTPGRGL